ncbi:MAG: DEAD/DEAH box helicase [Sulfuricellaceae bacterium]|nr:DEAD/DEAH box helicase [Sulfuricellaceae bacterium]
MSFESLNLNPSILKAIVESGYTEPTAIQSEAIPVVLAGHDLMASAQTGTGKTAAFMLPALHKLATPSAVKSKGPRVLVLTPTRELATQVNDAARKYGKTLRVNTVSILGGMPYPLQNKLLSGFVDILVATPGRLIDHIDRGRIDFSRLEMLILDEADRMLDMGFIEDVEKIAAATPASRQTLLFSATLDGNIGKLATRLLKDPKRIQIAAQQDRHENIEQRLHYVDDLAHKNRLLQHLVTDTDLKQAIVFTSTKRDADMLAEDLFAQGHSAAALHGDMNQGARNRTLTKLRRGGIRILVATDVAARGIDVPGISHVINFDLPKFAEDYVHRIGRTGRAGASGIAVSFASHKDMMHLKRIERFTGQNITLHTVPGMEPKRIPRAEAPRSGQGRKFSGKPGGSSAGNGGGYNNGNRSAAGQPRREGGGYARSGERTSEKRPNSGGAAHHSGRRHG